MPAPERLDHLFSDYKAIDLHVNVGLRTGDSYYDGLPEEEAVRRQFDLKDLHNTKLQRIGLRTHYSTVEIPQHLEFRFIPSVAINCIGTDPSRVEQELSRFSHPRPIVWFQSFRDPYHRFAVDSGYRRAIAASGSEESTISHTDQFGRLTRQTLEILEIARDRRAIIATPHSNYERTLPLIIEAVQMGLTVLWVHPDSRLIQTPLAVQKEIAKSFAGKVFIERAAVFLRDGKRGTYTAEKAVSDVREIGIEHIVFTSDLGRYNPNDPLLPDEGLKWFLEKLLDAGLTTEEAELGVAVNPTRIMEELR